MKRVHELTEAELLALDDDQFNRQVDYECAVEGIAMLPPHPGKAPQNTLPTADAKVFKVADVYTTDADHAAAILALITSKPLFKKAHVRGYEGPEYLVPMGESDYGFPKIEKSTVFSPEQWDSIKEDQKAYSDLKKEWDAEMRVYNELYEGRKYIIQQLSDRLREAQTRKYTRDRLREEFSRYMDLAEGNRQIALNFLEKAKDLSEFPELREEFCPPQPAERSA